MDNIKNKIVIRPRNCECNRGDISNPNYQPFKIIINDDIRTIEIIERDSGELIQQINNVIYCPHCGSELKKIKYTNRS